jgi:phage terminase large subunit-like protein
VKKNQSSKVSRNSLPDAVTEYAQSVVNGTILAGPHVRDACKRHLRDLINGPDRGLRWDPAAAQLTFEFYEEVLCLNGGEFEGKPFQLEPSQKFIIGSLFGWFNTDDGSRRFRVAYIEEGKGNGKSPLVAGIGLKMLVADKEPRAEIYAVATKRDQAQVLFRDAVAMKQLSPLLDGPLKTTGGRGREWNISFEQTGSFFRTLASDDAQSGPRPHCALIDEVHEHKTGLMVEMMRAGVKGRRQAMIVMITNSGTDKESVCWQYHEYAANICSGILEDDAFFGYVCALDEKDEPFEDEACWVKANPLLGVSIKRRYLQDQIREARGMPSKEARVRRLNFCQWTEATDPLFSPDLIKATQEEYDEELLLGRKCYGGLDLSSTSDLTAFVLLFAPNDQDDKWRQKAWFWLPQATLDNKERLKKYPIHMPVWRAAGWIETTRGAAISKLHVLKRLVECHEKFAIQSIAYDRWRIEDLKILMSDAGAKLPLEPYGQGFKDMAPAVDEYERLLISDELRHDGNPVMTWNMSCVVVETDPAGNRKPTKERSTGRIDGAVAAIMAAGRSKPKPEPKYQTLFLGSESKK